MSSDTSVTQIKWSIDDREVVAVKNSLDRWNIYAITYSQENIAEINHSQYNISSDDLMKIVQEFKQNYLYKYDER